MSCANSTILKNSNNPVQIIVTGLDLTDFDYISVTFGSDTRTSLANPESVIVVDANNLDLVLLSTNFLIYS